MRTIRPSRSSTTTRAPTVSRIADTTLRSSCKLLFRLLKVRDVERHPLDEPRSAVRAEDHLRFATEPDHPAVACDYPVGRAQRLAREKHLRSFHAPAGFVVGMDLLIPHHRILKPFRLREPQCRLNLRAYVRLADTTVQVRHEHDRRKLLEQRPVLGFQIRELCFSNWILVQPLEQVMETGPEPQHCLSKRCWRVH